MESTLNDFFNEINQIAPLRETRPKKETNEWKECLDSKSGFTYYWNTLTNEVTWEKPKNFSIQTSVNDSVPNINELKDKIKIYKISPPAPKQNGNISIASKSKVAQRKGTHSDSEDEKITLITSYGSSSSSEDENNEEKTTPKKLDDVEEDALSTVLKRAEALKNLGNADIKTLPKTHTVEVEKSTKPISGFSLVAGYDSDSDEENGGQTVESSTTIEATPTSPTKLHSTLFPIMQAPNINDFETAKEPLKDESPKETSFDMKTFKRKRRLGVNFVPNQNVKRPSSPNAPQDERKGLGFKENAKEAVATSSKDLYSNFTKGGVEFVKPNEEERNEVNEKEIVEIYEILHEKLAFLCEGNKDVLPVQIILIQIETLYGALKAESLKPEYLHDWLQGTSEDLIKLEKEAAPEGWTLQWDRLQKRYYYQNRESGQTQWEFPRVEFERQEEAMDICTTPPPPEITENEVEEGENTVDSNRIPSPPPAPIISKPETESIPEHKTFPVAQINQPLPPGVDYVETVSQEKNDIDSAFNTFYSELAEIEKTSKPCSPTTVTEQTEVSSKKKEELAEPVKKKRKKMKLGQGLSLKNKDVSKLVEKWKSVQNNY